ncbi:hypothetical protein POM88_027543 [Heracleum sosnowskyi]|uniref:Uncharacterized protein n=1 Tax=Heracleum sosnowskyi TaxID=360622 RepID=A0AAD8I801_9APIA|nr:hypothetical protein POM88_027543 [Heracleum sosnowskyi]
MKVSAEIEKIPTIDKETRSCGTRKSKRHNMATSKTINILVLLVILIFGQLCTTSSAKHVNSGPSSWTLSRKAQGFRTVSVRAAATLSPSQLEAAYSNDKRLIHTGPNPLHN